MCLRLWAPMEVKRLYQTPWNWSYGWLQTTMWGLQAQLGFSTRATSALSHQTIFLHFLFCNILRQCLKKYIAQADYSLAVYVIVSSV